MEFEIRYKLLSFYGKPYIEDGLPRYQDMHSDIASFDAPPGYYWEMFLKEVK